MYSAFSEVSAEKYSSISNISANGGTRIFCKIRVRFSYNALVSNALSLPGAWNTDGKGESIWDHLLHVHPNFTEDHRNGNIANDFYHRYKEDIAILKDLGVDHFRMSISWPRILPYGKRPLFSMSYQHNDY